MRFKTRIACACAGQNGRAQAPPSTRAALGLRGACVCARQSGTWLRLHPAHTGSPHAAHPEIPTFPDLQQRRHRARAGLPRLTSRLHASRMYTRTRMLSATRLQDSPSSATSACSSTSVATRCHTDVTIAAHEHVTRMLVRLSTAAQMSP